jgi:hypothetical protein
MDENTKRDWENYLKLDKNQKVADNWKKFSDRFGKKNLLELFENGDKFLSLNNTNFKIAFEYNILFPLKKNKKLDFVKKGTYSSLMSLFSKFRYFLKDYKKNLHNNLLVDNNFNKLRNQEKNDIVKNFVLIPKEEQIMPYEKKYFKINEFGDVITP